MIPQTWTRGRAPVEGGELAYHRTGGEGPAAVLSHGLTDNGLCWSRLALALQDRFDLVMLDARGHGESSRVRRGQPFEPGEDIAQACEALGLAAPIVIGHSVGARATLDFAAAHPDRVSAVVLEDPPLMPVLGPAQAETRAARFRQEVEELQALSDDALAERGRQSHPGWPDEEFPPWLLSKRQVDPGALPRLTGPWQEAMSRLRVPTLLVHGEAGLGSLVTRDLAREAQGINPCVRAVPIAAAGHNVRRDNLSGYLTAVRTFLERQTGNSRAASAFDLPW